MATRPSTLPGWIPDNTTNITTPVAARLTNGWTPGSPPTGEEFNWFQNLVSQWLAYIDENGGGFYSSLTTALAALAEGDLAMVDEDDRNSVMGAAVSGSSVITSAGRYPISIDADGDRVVYLLDNGTAFAISRDWQSATIATTDRLATYTISQAWANGRRIITTGFYVCIAYGNYVDVFLASDGTLLHTVNHGAQVEDICADGTVLYLCGAQGTGSKQVRAVGLSGGVSQWTYNHGGAGVIYSIATDGRRCWFAGAASTSGSLATMRCVEAATGNDSANEGGTAASAYVDVWDLAGQVPDRGQTMVHLDGSVFVGFPGSQTHQVIEFSGGNGTELGTWDHADDVQAMAIDDDLLLVAIEVAGGGDLYAFQRQRFPALRWATYTPALPTQPPTCVATDGFKVYLSNQTGLVANIHRLYRGNRPTRVRRVDPLDNTRRGHAVFVTGS